MKRLFLSLCSAAFLLVACNNDKTEEKTAAESSSDTSSAKMDKMDDNAKKEQAWIPIDSAMEMKGMMDAAQVGEAHKMLAKSSGTWTADITMWMADGAPPMKSKGTTVNTMVLDGHYQQSKHSANMMGMAFEGISTVAYDNTEKKYVSTWIDNMGTGILVMSGNWDDATKSLNFSGKMKHPGNGLECTEREVFKVVDENHQTLEMFGPDPKTGKEYKAMEIQYTRKK